jgi:hypothetical protein
MLYGVARALGRPGTLARSGTRPAGARVMRRGVSRAHEPLRDLRVRECPFFRAHEERPAGEVRAAMPTQRNARCAA